jgi:NAD+ kinase
MKVAIYGRDNSSQSSADAMHALFQKLQELGIKFVVYEPFFKKFKNNLNLNAKYFFNTHNDIKGKVQFLFSIGGDGTLLETVTLVRNSNIPVIGINTGRLGFLSSISKDEIDIALDCLINKKYKLDKRTLLELNIKGKHFPVCKFALNEIAIQKADSSSMIIIRAYVNNSLLNTYWADGLIVATPTGSTAYSLSCGGPIVMPNSDNFVITPIAPHNLNVRPVIISSNDVVSLEIESRSPNFLASIDSYSEAISKELKIKIKKAKFSIALVKLPKHDFLSTLRNKLMWGVDKRN